MQELHIAFAVDDRGGMMFNDRRVSKDSALRKEVLDLARSAGGSVRVRPYSLTQFAEDDSVQSFDTPWSDAQAGDIVFIEDVDPATVPGVTKVTLFHWNRTYPYDLASTFGFDGFELTETKEFEGSSRERITEETWVKAL